MSTEAAEVRRRKTIVAKLEAGTLDRTPPSPVVSLLSGPAPTSIVIGVGNGEPCYACDEPIVVSEYKETRGDVVVHTVCLTTWFDEGPQTRRKAQDGS